MQFKKGYGWKACYDEETERYFGEYGGIQEYNLYELTKEQYDALDKKMKESDAGTIMHEGRHAECCGKRQQRFGASCGNITYHCCALLHIVQTAQYGAVQKQVRGFSYIKLMGLFGKLH